MSNMSTYEVLFTAALTGTAQSKEEPATLVDRAIQIANAALGALVVAGYVKQRRGLEETETPEVKPTVKAPSDF